MKIYENLKGEDFASVDMTGIWEEKLSKVAEGTYSFTSYECELRQYVKDTVIHIKQMNLNKYNSSKNVIGKCPICGKDFIEGKNGYFCSNENCDFHIGKKILQATISKTEVLKLIAGKETKEMKFVRNNGEEFKSKLHLEKDQLKFGNSSNKKESDVLCPNCGEHIIDTGKFFICKNYKNPCNFCLSHTLNGATFTINDIEKMLEGEMIEKEFTWKSGKKSTNKVSIQEENDRYSYKIHF